MKSSSRMIMNSGIMYARVLITSIISLLSSRWVLLALGKEDFGIYSLVAGLLIMLSFLNVTMASSTQRFLSYAIGQGDKDNLRETFYFSCILHLCVGIVVLLIIEILGVLSLNTFLQVPEGKLDLAMYVLHSLSISTFFSIISVPYNATLITHENMLFVAIVQIIESVLKLVTAISLQYSEERLKFYAMCMTAIPILSALIYRWYCHRNYEETHIIFHKKIDKQLFKQFTSYTGWNLIGGLSSLTRTQGVVMLLNSFFGVIVNAAYGIATQVNGQVKFFSATIVTAMRPQIIKSEGMGDRARMHALSATTCKSTFLMLSIIVIPLIVEMQYVLQIWLKNVPEYTVTFTRIILIVNLIAQLSTGISIGVHSVGKIKSLQLSVSMLQFLVIPLGYLFLRLGFSPYYVLYVVIVEEIIGLIVLLCVSHKVTGLNIQNFLIKCVCPCILTALLVYCSCFSLTIILPTGIIRVIASILVSITITVMLSFTFVMNINEKTVIFEFIKKMKKK